MRARILVRDLDLQDVQVGAPAKVKVLPMPFRTFTGTVDRIKPATSEDRPVAETEKLERMGQQLTNLHRCRYGISQPRWHAYGRYDRHREDLRQVRATRLADRPLQLALDSRTSLVNPKITP